MKPPFSSLSYSSSSSLSSFLFLSFLPPPTLFSFPPPSPPVSLFSFSLSFLPLLPLLCVKLVFLCKTLCGSERYFLPNTAVSRRLKTGGQGE